MEHLRAEFELELVLARGTFRRLEVALAATAAGLDDRDNRVLALINNEHNAICAFAFSGRQDNASEPAEAGAADEARAKAAALTQETRAPNAFLHAEDEFFEKGWGARLAGR